MWTRRRYGGLPKLSNDDFEPREANVLRGGRAWRGRLRGVTGALERAEEKRARKQARRLRERT